MRTAAGAFLSGQGADISGTITHHRECFLVDRRENKLALGAFGKHFAGIGIDDLGNEVILVDMHAALCGALEGNAGARKLGQSVDVIGLDAQGILNILAHLLAPGFRAEDTGLERDIIRSVAHFLHTLAEISGVAGRAAEDRRLQIHDEHDLTVGIAGAGRDRQTADLMGAAVQAGAAGEQTVSVGNLADILFGAAGCHDRSGAALFPQIDIMLCVESDDALSGGTGGGLDPDAVLQGLAHQAVGIGFSQIALGQERKLVKVINGLDVFRRHAFLFHFPAIIRDIVPDMLYLLDELLVLYLNNSLSGSAFNVFLIVSLHMIS